MSCYLCGRGIVGECDCPPEQETAAPVGSVFGSEPLESKIDGRRKADEEITVSAGRKRAAAQYPIDRDAPCEWRGLANVGGGRVPITGCINGKQQHLQHGPIKATHHNERTNIHKICATCHNRWHAANDPVYDESAYAKLPHTPHQATPEELIQNEINWKTGTYSKELIQSYYKAQGRDTDSIEGLGEGSEYLALNE